MELWFACSEIFAKLGIGGQINFLTLNGCLYSMEVHYNNDDLEHLLINWRLEGRIEDNGGPLNEYSSFKNLTITKPASLYNITSKKLVDDDPKENLDFPNGRVSE